jgi:hypothetical protein
VGVVAQIGILKSRGKRKIFCMGQLLTTVLVRHFEKRKSTKVAEYGYFKRYG